MNRNEFAKQWLAEEAIAHVHGWDFSHIHGRYEEENDLPWDYSTIVRAYLCPEKQLLDIDTGGGEFLLSLQHPHERTSATEFYAPNVKLCRDKLLPLGINFKEADGSGKLPFANHYFDIVINRHGNYCAEEIGRVLKHDGIFITEQVGAENDRGLISLILPEVPELPFPEQYLNIAVKKFERNGFTMLMQQETFRPIRFFDVGALVWFAHVIKWEFPGFTVKSSLPLLYQAQDILGANGYIEAEIHRFLIVARKNHGIS